MPETNVLLYFAIEIAVVLLFVCIFLLVHVTRQKKLATSLVEKIRSLRSELQLSKMVAESVVAPATQHSSTYSALVDELLDETLEYHTSLAPDGNITLDISRDAPLERQVCALRYAFLLAEKEALYAGGAGQNNWAVLQTRLGELFDLYLPLENDKSPAEANTVSPAEGVEADDQLAGKPVGEDMNKKIADLQQEYLNLQTQYIELEERYMELKEG